MKTSKSVIDVDFVLSLQRLRADTLRLANSQEATPEDMARFAGAAFLRINRLFDVLQNVRDLRRSVESLRRQLDRARYAARRIVVNAKRDASGRWVRSEMWGLAKALHDAFLFARAGMFVRKSAAAKRPFSKQAPIARAKQSPEITEALSIVRELRILSSLPAPGDTPSRSLVNTRKIYDLSARTRRLLAVVQNYPRTERAIRLRDALMGLNALLAQAMRVIVNNGKWADLKEELMNAYSQAGKVLHLF